MFADASAEVWRQQLHAASESAGAVGDAESVPLIAANPLFQNPGDEEAAVDRLRGRIYARSERRPRRNAWAEDLDEADDTYSSATYPSRSWLCLEKVIMWQLSLIGFGTFLIVKGYRHADFTCISKSHYDLIEGYDEQQSLMESIDCVTANEIAYIQIVAGIMVVVLTLVFGVRGAVLQ